MVALDSDDGEFFVVSGYTNGDWGEVNGEIKAYSPLTLIHKNNQWHEMEKMPTDRYGKRRNLAIFR